MTIGRWNNNGCITAVLPQCLHRGSRPAPIQAGSGATGYFPFYNGPAATARIRGEIFDGCKYADGVLDHSAVLANPANGHDTAACVKAEYSQAINNTQGFTVHGWINVNDVFGTADYLDWFGFHGGSAAGAEFWGLYLQTNGLGAGLGPKDSIATQTQTPTSYNYVYDDGKDLSPGYHMFTSVKDGQDLRCFIDGIEATNAYLAAAQYNGSGAFTRMSFGVRDYHYTATNLILKGFSKAFIVYDNFIGATRIAEDYALGPDLGGLYGYDNMDGTLRLLANPLIAGGQKRSRTKVGLAI